MTSVSENLTLAAFTLTTTLPGPASSGGRSSMTNDSGGPQALHTTAFICVLPLHGNSMHRQIAFASGKLIAEQQFPRGAVGDLVLRVARQLPEKGPEILVPLPDAMHAVAAEVERGEKPLRVRDQQVQPILPEPPVLRPYPRVPLAAERID